MAKEIERKFLIKDPEAAIKEATSRATKVAHIDQGYFTQNGLTVRVRIASGTATLTLKGPKKGLVSDEYEYTIPIEDAAELLEKYSISRLTKIRYVIPLRNVELELDVYQGSLADNMLAEVELPSPNLSFEKPKWLGEEVTKDKRYSNSNISLNGWPK